MGGVGKEERMLLFFFWAGNARSRYIYVNSIIE